MVDARVVGVVVRRVEHLVVSVVVVVVAVLRRRDGRRRVVRRRRMVRDHVLLAPTGVRERLTMSE